MKKASFIHIGLAIFAMFFGSGNLTFPLFVGQIAQNGNTALAIIGFCLTGVLLPCIGLFVLIANKSDYHAFFEKAGKFFGGKYLIPILLAIWIPFGTAPRCITVAFAGFKPFLPGLPLWAFSLGLCALMYLMVAKRHRFLNILGYVLTPVLLGSIILLVGMCYLQEPTALPAAASQNIFWTSLFQGYNTMDLIAACFFSTSILKLLKQNTQNQALKAHFSLLFKASLFGMAILGLVYTGMIAIAARHYTLLAGLGKEEMLPRLAQIFLGPEMGLIASVAIVFACATTLAALVLVYADYLKGFKKRFIRNNATLITIAITFLLSLIGFDGINRLTEPLLQVLYPILILIVLGNMTKHLIQIYLRNSNCNYLTDQI